VSQQINLYNPALAPKVQLLSGRRLVLGLVAALAACLVIWGAAGTNAARMAGAERAQAARLAQLQAEVTALTQQVAGRAQRRAAGETAAGALLAARHEVMALLAGGSLGDTRGDSICARSRARPRWPVAHRPDISGAAATSS
jgi:hypothetical protein